MHIKKANSVNIILSAQDQDGATITDLATTSEIYFMMKNAITDLDAVAVISKQKTISGITVDSPLTGQITIALSATDTNIDAKDYYIAVQLEYPDGTKNELSLKEDDRVFNKITVQSDIIRG